ncbi:MAG: iron-sulfur cluster carrier protein ApbC [Candidatus Methylomirabilis sp.]|nr:iron-sulfur cluster carrier protein ApbC [Deltaproteobacteria bacterium]
MNNITEAVVLDALRSVMDPELGKDLVTLNMIRDVKVEGGKVSFTLMLTTMACPLKKELEANSVNAVKAIPGVTEVSVTTGAEVPKSKEVSGKAPIPGVKNTIAVASGKGGVGKSTVAVNLAVALAQSGAKVGLLDTDLYGPSLPLMMGIHEPLQATPEERLVPLEKYGMKLVSVGFMLDEETPLIWRGPLVMQLIKQFLVGVEWGELDYLVIDLPPGTGDTQLTLVQTIPLTGAVIVTTPQDVALIDARRAIRMFKEVKVPVLGIIENMSQFVCPHCGGATEIFSKGGGEKTSERYQVPLLGKIPIDIAIREGGDTGMPITHADPNSAHSKAFVEIAQSVAAKVSVLDLE